MYVAEYPSHHRTGRCDGDVELWNTALSSVTRKRPAYDNLPFEAMSLFKSNYCTQLEPPV